MLNRLIGKIADLVSDDRMKSANNIIQIGIGNSINIEEINEKRKIEAATQPMKEPHESTQSLIVSDGEKTRKKLDDIIQSIKVIQGRIPIGGDATDDDLEKELNAEIDDYRDLILKSEPKSALELFSKLKTRIWEKTSDKIKFRISTNIGSAYLKLGDFKNASKSFFEAEKYDEKSEKAISNVALAYHLSDNKEQAVFYAKKALVINPDYTHGYSILIAVTFTDSPEDLVPAKYHSNKDICFALGDAYLRKKQFGRAIQYLEKAYKSSPDDIQIAVGLADARLMRLAQKEGIHYGVQNSKNDLIVIHEIIRLYSQVHKKIGENGSGVEYIALLFNYASALRLNGDLLLALEIMNRAIALNNSDGELILQKIRLLMEKNDFVEVDRLITSFLPDTIINQNLIHAEALSHLGRFEDAYEMLNGSPIFDDVDEISIAARILLLNIIKGKDGYEIAGEKCKDFLNQFPDILDFKLELSKFYRESGQHQKSIQIIEEINNNPSNDLSLRTKVNLANEYYQSGLYDGAAELLESFCDTSTDSELLRNYLQCLTKTENRSKVKEILNGLDSSYQENLFYVQVNCWLYERTGELNKSLEYYKLFFDKRPEDLYMRVHWILILRRIGYHQQIIKYLSQDSRKLQGDLKDRITFYQLLKEYGFIKRCISEAYKLINEYPNEGDAHFGYIALMLGLSDQDFLSVPIEIQLDSAFCTLDNSGTRDWYIIDTEVEENVSRKILGETNPIALKVIGARQNQTVVLFENEFNKEERKIFEIKNKYIYALHECLRTFEEKFPYSSNYFQKIQIKNEKDAIESVNKILTVKKAQEDEILDKYRNKFVPLSFLAKFFRCNIVNIFDLFRYRNDVKLICCKGTVDEAKKAASNIKNANGNFIIDTLSIFMIHELGIENELLKTTGKLGVVQSTIDSFNNLRADIQQKGVGLFSVFKQGEKLYRQEHTKKEIDEAVSKIDGVIFWIKNNCEIIPAIPDVSLEPSRLERMNFLLQDASDLILAANGNKKIIISEDLRLREIASQHYQVEGVWLYPILNEMLVTEMITFQKYVEIIAHLIKWGFSFISVNANMLNVATSSEIEHSRDDFSVLLATLGEENTDLKSSLVVAKHYLKLLWAGPFSEFSKQKMTSMVLSTLTKKGCLMWSSKNGHKVKQLLN